MKDKDLLRKLANEEEVTKELEQAFLEGFEDRDESPKYIDFDEKGDDFEAAFEDIPDEFNEEEGISFEEGDGFDDDDDLESEFGQKDKASVNSKQDNKDGNSTKTMKVNFMGKQIEVPEEEVKSLVQKGLNHDRMEIKYRKMQGDNQMLDGLKDLAAYFNVPAGKYISDMVTGIQNQEIKKLTSSGIPLKKAQDLVGQSDFIRTNRSRTKDKGRDLKSEVAEFMMARPDLKGMKVFPQEVSMAVNSGSDLKSAYMRYEFKKMADELKKLAAENSELNDDLKRLGQNNKTLSAPKSQKGRGAAARKMDLFLQGFNEDY